MNHAPTISVVMPTHNGAPFIRQAIESCQRQTHTDWELVIVDDASTDETPDLLQDAAARDGRIRVLTHPANRMLPAALNTGFEASRGRLLTWTSDDNWYEPDALAVMEKGLEGNAHVDLVYTAMYMETTDPPRSMPRRVRRPWRLPLENVVGACFMFRRSVWEQAGPDDEDLPGAEDYDFWLRASRHHRFASIPLCLYHYRRHSGSLTATRMACIRMNTLRALEKSCLTATALPRVRALAALHAAALAEQAGDLDQAARYRRMSRECSALIYLVFGRLGPLKHRWLGGGRAA